MPYYQDPSGLASFWVNDGESIEAARRRHAAQMQQSGGDPATFADPRASLPPGDYGRVLPGTQGVAPTLPPPSMQPLGGGSSMATSRTAQFNPNAPFETAPATTTNAVDPLAGHQPSGPPPPFVNPFYPAASPPAPTSTGHPTTPGPTTAPPPPYSYTPTPSYRPPTTAGPIDPQYGTINMFDEAGNQVGPPAIPQIDLGAPPEVSGLLPQDARQQYVDMMNALQHSAGEKFNYAIPDFNAAQMGVGDVPQPTAERYQSSPEIMAMLSGQGLAPNILSQLRARATEDVSGAGRLELGQARRALSQAGLSQSPAGAAVQQDVARRTAGQQTSALRDIDIQNAMLGLENQRLGVGYQFQGAMSNMEAANQMALNNANRLFSAMSQNLANQQQAAGAEFGAESTRRRDKAGTEADIIGQQGNILQSAAANRMGQADFFNASNTINQGLNQAQLDRQRAMANQGAQENRYGIGTSILAGFAPTNFNAPNQQGFSPIGSTLANVGGSILNDQLTEWQRRRNAQTTT